MTNIEPYLSVVATARNDNHGGNLLGRMQIFVSGLLQQAERHKVPLELILVEWNPPSDKPVLAEVLQWPKNLTYASVRIVQFPANFHRTYEHWDRLPLYQMIGKNVGIRRARGKFILSTNIDILFSDELFDYFARRKLSAGKMYRVDRYDVDENIPSNASLDEWLMFCRKNIIRLNHLRGSVNMLNGEYHQHKSDDCELFPEDYNTPILYTNACGDFQLMAREHWFQLHGYPEFDMYSFHLDSIMEFMAHYAGAKEERLGEPFRIYHIEHDNGWRPEEKKATEFEESFERRKIKKLTDDELNEIQFKMVNENAPTVFNDQNWGWGNVTLPETMP